MPLARSAPSATWDLFCRVVDNFGDIGVCWRLACDLASRGVTVRLWVDDASALAWMAPLGCAGVSVLPWVDPPLDLEPGDVVIEAFGCDPPEAFLARMAAKPSPPVWINLEYLSAETDVERSHRLPSPRTMGAGAGLTKTFFYPGFTPRTGGLLREPDLMQRRAAFDSAAWLRTRGISAHAGERVVSLFCYANPALPALVDELSREPTLLLVCPGPAAQQLTALLAPHGQHEGLRAILLPHLTQRDYDHLLWACDLNFVRGEDSFVRAQWAGRPFIWQIYPQSDDAHRGKLQAFVDRHLLGIDSRLAARVRHSFDVWNGFAAAPLALAPHAEWHAATLAWREALLRQADLCSQLLGHVAERR